MVRGKEAFPPKWACAWGRDRYGVYAEFEVRGVRQRMRWRGPTVFMMGSPETEKGREETWGDETLHEVELTRGYWLADTACTETMWEAAGGQIRGERVGLEHPIGSVSWEDVTAWIGRLNAGIGDGFRLPTESEWEHACRAGTKTAFAYGDELSPERARFGLSTRDGPGPVRSFEPNGWGFHEMHGNVWEWCDDWYGNYPKMRTADPRGPDHGGDRVLRGGSWLNPAVNCRSAQRDGLHPSRRRRDYGFRLARGRSQPAAGETPA